VHAAGAVAPAAGAGAGACVCLSTIAGVLTTDGAAGAGRSMTRVQATSAVLAKTSTAMVAFMRSFLLKQLPSSWFEWTRKRQARFRPLNCSSPQCAKAGTAVARRRESTPRKDHAMQRKDKVEGEGSYSGSKDYNERTRKFVEQGKVEDAAHKAQPKSESEKHAMQKAERIGKAHAKDEDPALRDPKKIPDDPNFPRKK
jgi:hypothetical protein